MGWLASRPGRFKTMEIARYPRVRDWVDFRADENLQRKIYDVSGIESLIPDYSLRGLDSIMTSIECANK